MVRGANVISYKVYVQDVGYLTYELEETALAAAKMYAREGRAVRVIAVMEVEVWSSEQT